ncbi:MAG: hypothetical protein EBY16_04235 [Gammaproteobacteria bacterium]|nr:hypothetical protein [Gammaproteobacteria bacterium]
MITGDHGVNRFRHPSPISALFIIVLTRKIISYTVCKQNRQHITGYAMRYIYIPTNKYYNIPTYEEYHQTKKQHLQAIDPQYDTKNPSEKWTLLIAKLTDSLSPKHMPLGMQVRTFQTSLDRFKTKRVNTSNSRFNLSLTQCVNYFEEFNFLYNTTDARYKLTDDAKKDLLKSIHAAFGVCETGLNTDLYSALQSHQKEHDWIQNELVKARCETLHQLQTQYGSSDVHVYNKLVQLANNAQLGIPQKEEILDAHAGIMVDSTKLTAFFNQHYPALFATYEKQIEDSLTNHYLSEFTKMLGICSADWEAGPVTIPFINTRDITGSMNAYFQGVPTDDILYALGELTDDCAQYTLKSKQDVAKIIKGLVAKKLIADEYLVSLDQVTKDRAAHQNLRLKKGVVVDELINLHDVLQQNNPEQIQDKLQQNVVILMSYPELVISLIDSNPAILSSIPRWLRADTRFVDSSLVVLNQLLCNAIDENNEDAIRTLTAQVLNLIQSEYGYLQQLSEPVFKNPLVAAMLVEKNGLLFAYLDDELQKNAELRSQFKGQDRFGAYHSETELSSGSDMIRWAHFKAQQSLPNEYKNEPGLALHIENITLHQSMANFLRIKAFIALLTPSALTQREVFACVNDLNPDLLLKVIDYRKRKQLPPLPFFNNDKTGKELEKFNQELSVELTPDWSQDYLSIKRRACEQENFACIRDPFAMKNAVTFLSKTDNWFAGFNQYHAYQSNNEKLWAKLMMAARALYDLVITMAEIGLYLAFIYYTLPVLCVIVDFYCLQGLLTYFCLWLLNLYLNNSLISTVNNVILIFLMLDAIFLAVTMFLIYNKITPLYSALIGIFDSLMAMLSIITNSFSYFTSKNEYLAETLEETCENTLVRLDGIYEESAQEKSELLRGLLTQVKTEANQDPGHSFKELLDKKYQVSYRGRTHNVSFLEVASKRRAHYGVFKLDDQPNRMGFFSCRTTTEALLTTVEPGLQMMA